MLRMESRQRGVGQDGGVGEEEGYGGYQCGHCDRGTKGFTATVTAAGVHMSRQPPRLCISQWMNRTERRSCGSRRTGAV